MFNHPTLLYWCWKDAEREARRNPNSGGGGGGCLWIVLIMFVICLWKAALSAGGYGVIIALMITLGLISGLVSSE